MRLIGHVNSESDARRFGDFLVTLSMRNHVEQANSGAWQIWVEHDDHVDQAVAQFHAYQANPNDPKYADADAAARKIRREEKQAAERRRRQFTDVRTSFAKAGARGTPLAILLLGACVLLFFIMRAGNPEVGDRIREALIFQPLEPVQEKLLASSLAGESPSVGKYRPATMFTSIVHGEFWRLFTPALMHGNLMHLLFNMLWLATLGAAIESRRGTGFFFSLVLAAGVISNCGEALWAVYGFGNPNGWIPFWGFSGVNYALFGYAWLVGRLRPYEKIGVSQQTVGLMLAWLIICMTNLMGPVANTAHVVGLAVGCFAAAWPNILRKMKAR